MNVWRMSKSQTTPMLVTMIGAALVALMASFMYSYTLQAAPIGDGSTWRGTIQEMPSNGFIGAWKIDGRIFSANDATELNQDEGTLQVGGCAKVKYKVDGATNLALQIESQSGNDCNEHDQTPTATPLPETIPPTATPDDDGDHDGHGGDHDNAPHGRINSLPDDPELLGNWVISGTTYVVTTTTKLEQKFGAFKVDACVQVKSDKSTTPATALRIATKQDFVCSSDEDDGDDDHDTPPGLAHGRLFGVIQSFPITLTGTWRIGGMDFVADSNSTKFDQEHGAFAISVTVEVKFYIDANGVNHATKIESKFANDHHGDDDDGNGIHEGTEGQLFGTVDSFPDGLVGVWIVGGIELSSTHKTKFKPEHGAFVPGVRVKVEFFLDANNQLIAHEIETTQNDGGVADSTDFMLFGFVQALPTGGFTGTWNISNITFTTDLSTTFKEGHIVFAKGAFVSVEYTVTNGSKVIHAIETLVPPGCGEHDHMGKIEDMGDDNLAAASVSKNSVWRIGGQSYVVTPSTNLNDVLGALAVNQTAVVNSYTAADGSEVATQIRGLAINSQIFLPLTSR